MNKKIWKILLYDLGQYLLVALELASLCAIAYGAYKAVWFAIQMLISPIDAAFMLQIADAVPEKFAFVGDVIRKFFQAIGFDEAKSSCIRYAIVFGGGILGLLLSRWLLRVLEVSFKRRFMPQVLAETFSECSYAPKKRRSVDEPLCRVDLLHYIERYYSANRLEGLYRGCWVASEEIVCGGVYLNNYTSHRVKVRGQWLTIRLNRDFDGCVILESTGTKNRFTHHMIAKRMNQIEFDYPVFTERFYCYSDSNEDAQALLNREMADKLLKLLDRYPDLCVIFENGCVHFLVRRRSFDRRWEYLVPFCLPYLRQVAKRLYTPLQDVTDALLE